MTRRGWLLIVLLLALAAAIAAGVLLSSAHSHQLTYSVTSSQHHLKATLSDNRSGKNTDWVKLLNPPKGVRGVLIRSFHDGSVGGDATVSVQIGLPAGVYRYAIYSADKLNVVSPEEAQYWTPEHRVAEGQVTVP
jgi:hypothetical protein